MKPRRKLLFTSLFILMIIVLISAPARLLSRAQQAVSKWMVLTIILDRIQRYYVEERDPEQLLDHAIDGVMENLDQYSQYLSPEEAKEYAKKFHGYFGVGLSFRLTSRGYIVSSIHPNSPAAEADVRLGDGVKMIDGRRLSNHSAHQLDQYLSSLKGEYVEIELVRPPQSATIPIRLLKRRIDLPCIPAAFMLNDSVGYVTIFHFGASAAEEFDRAFERLIAGGMKQLILDLRNNPGGDLHAGISVAERLIPSGRIIAYTKGRSPEAEEHFVSSPPRRYPVLPLIVLVNEKSASDAEIIAGAVQDWDRGIIVGRRTFGKAMVQTEYPFQDGSLLLLTTARFYTPMGRLIQKEESGFSEQVYRTPMGRALTAGGGIVPDFEVKTNSTPSPLIKRLKNAAVDPFYDFADYWMQQSAVLPFENIETFIRQFNVTDELLSQFADYAAARRIPLNSAEFEQNKKEAADELYISTAYRLFGEEGRITASAYRDEEVRRCLFYVDEAAKLLKK